MASKYYWVKERHNPQTGIYFVPCGQLTIKEAKAKEKSIYGHNYMHKFETHEGYNAYIDKLKDIGERVHI